jgi:hypothetical protein
MCEDQGWSAVVVGDTKTPTDWASPNVTFLSVNDQFQMFGELAKLIPFRHYSRKNLGYLYAIQNGAKIILETDDDNIPNNNFGNALHSCVDAESIGHKGWVNIYRYFSDAIIWPRGLSLEAIYSTPPLQETGSFDCPIQQYLADDDPDVDAIYRLLYKDQVQFKQRRPIVLQAGTWCPFNSQNTAFFDKAFPLMYLPCHVSFRMTDIWRSFVAQAALWVHRHHLSFHPATVRQVRNDHNLMHDFRDEVPGYLENDRITKILSSECENGSSTSIAKTAHRMWRTLAAERIIPEEELPILDAWFARFEGAAL